MKMLSEKLDLILFEEVFRDKYDLLGKFFVDRKKWALPMQMSFLNNRFNQYKEATSLNKAIMDRSIYSDDIFARMYKEQGYLADEEYFVYKSIYDTLLEQVNTPVLIVYLKISTEEALKRIQKRGREDELQVENNYWEKLNEFYDENYNNYDKSSLLTLDVTGIDFVHNTNDAEFIINEIQQSWADSKKEKLKKVSSL